MSRAVRRAGLVHLVEADRAASASWPCGHRPRRSDVVVGFITALRAARYGSASTPQDVPPLAFMIVPLFDLLMFVILFGAAVYYRRRPAAHKRLMLLTAVNFLPPTIARIPVAALQGLC